MAMEEMMIGCFFRSVILLVLGSICAYVLYIQLGNYTDYTVEINAARVHFEPTSKIREIEDNKENAGRTAVWASVAGLFFYGIGLWFAVADTRYFFQERADLEERRHQELLEATRQAHQPVPKPASDPSSMDDPDYQYILKSEKLYRAGKLDEAIAMLELSNSPKAKKVLKNLKAMKDK